MKMSAKMKRIEADSATPPSDLSINLDQVDFSTKNFSYSSSSALSPSSPMRRTKSEPEMIRIIEESLNVKGRQRRTNEYNERDWFVPNFDEVTVDELDIPLFFEHEKLFFEIGDVHFRKMLFHIVVTFNAGFLNVIAYSSPQQQPVCHMTGHASRISMYDDENDRKGLGESANLILFFFLGAGIPSLFSYRSDEKPSLRCAIIYCGATLLIVAALLVEIYIEEHMWYLYFLACSAGYQNSLLSVFSGHSYRTTHVTGTITDAAIIFFRTLFVGYYSDTRKLFQLIPSLLSYIAGGFGGYAAYKSLERQAIVYNIMMMICVSLYLAFGNQLIDFLRIFIYGRDVFGNEKRNNCGKYDDSGDSSHSREAHSDPSSSGYTHVAGDSLSTSTFASGSNSKTTVVEMIGHNV
jgi:uncharacterized membrane protein YoaK (UPF0700 family)